MEQERHNWTCIASNIGLVLVHRLHPVYNVSCLKRVSYLHHQHLCQTIGTDTWLKSQRRVLKSITWKEKRFSVTMPMLNKKNTILFHAISYEVLKNHVLIFQFVLQVQFFVFCCSWSLHPVQSVFDIHVPMHPFPMTVP